VKIAMRQDRKITAILGNFINDCMMRLDIS
jgi:hypothetical protein